MDANANSAEGRSGVSLENEVIDLALSAGRGIVWSLDFASDRLSWGPGLDTLLGVSGGDDAEIRARLAELIKPLVLASRTTELWKDLDLEQPYETPDGDLRWLRFTARRNEEHLLGIAHNVTDRHEDRRELADLADRYRLLVELSPDMIAVHQDGALVYANPAAVRFAGGESPAALLGRPITDFVDTRSKTEMLGRLKRLSEPGATTEPAEAVFVRPDGTSCPMEVVSVRTTWAGRPAYQVIMRDVSAQKAAEAALRYQAALVQHVSDAIIATDAKGRVTSWNPAAETIYGLPSGGALGRRVSELVGAQLDPGAVIRAGGVSQQTHRAADGAALTVRVSAAEMDDGYVLVCADETARRRAERQYSTVVASLDEGVLVISPGGTVLSANPAAERILGVPESAMLGSSPHEWPIYDESGKRMSPSEYPSAQVRRTGIAQQGRVMRVLRRDGHNVWLSASCRAMNPEDTDYSAYVLSFTDITERRAIGERLEHDATHDPLTGLANRTLVLDELSARLHGPRRASTAVLFIDLDKFKVINDSLGHSVGDRVLRIAGERLRRTVRRDDVVGRLGGDEFVVIASGVHGDPEVRALTEHLRDSLSRPISVDGRKLHVDASIGIVLAAGGDPRAADELLRDADVAMYQAKTLGRGRYEFFDVELRRRMQRRLRLEQDLRDAVRLGKLWAAYQPVVDLRSGKMVAVEGLLRWTHPVHGAVPPAEFIPLAEESDLIRQLGSHVLRMTTHELAARRRSGLDVELKINLSTRQLDDPGLVPEVEEALRTTGLPAKALCLEITESALMRDSALAGETLAALREIGVRLAIDDFGTGYSSLAQLQRLTLDTLKIDRSFVMRLGESADAEAIVRSIIAMAHAVKLTVVAEGVEHQGQLDLLRELDCDQAQGYYLGKPMPARELWG
ncbi:diguanylate cyclase (GGDEF)-like protein/PAS domain S-box-containing protein [Amycolatopsis bartoniae]|uniref:GGDEF domain-containing protein n=1 Tax=Amycolatopsis bartoniae TaxID=941986 RepID=A0A8H9IUY1_9PSEU|nr:GGDEF domain-containing phosphodiesterase [Amycolatopsis bartoniae]MBB2935263.1 diguanylate cyclase (GGDEF)-like protein/PAS domain S-box-containing protein [Amycolatopsis bartoniae]TVT06826.1 EAL domain-containing protein [Amycolatopsis bartoniae]GHF55584.1 GGDEF domain-containing protein [Amycolatopsis bartoniae]